MSPSRCVNVCFFAPPPLLARLVSTLFLIDVRLPEGTVFEPQLAAPAAPAARTETAQ